MANLFIFNFFISLLLFYYYIVRKKIDRVIRFIIMTVMPISGIILFISLDIWIFYFSKYKNKKILLERKEKTKFISLLLRKSEIDKWEDIVPIEDALVLNDNITRRNLIMNTLKGDDYTHLSFLKKAVKDKDTEVSHYAAIAMMEVKRKLTNTIKQLESKYELGDKKDSLISEAYAKSLKKYTESGLLDNKSYIKYMDAYSKVLQNIINTKDVKEIYYEDKIQCDISMKKYDETISICRKYMKEFPNSDKPYILLLKIYFLTNNKIKFNEVMKELIESNIRIKSESLEIVRFWLRGDFLR